MILFHEKNHIYSYTVTDFLKNLEISLVFTQYPVTAESMFVHDFCFLKKSLSSK